MGREGEKGGVTKEARVERRKREKGKEAETSSGVMPEAEARDSVTEVEPSGESCEEDGVD